jgi:uncharacterized protein YaiE (UPF0345 family)
MPTNDFLSPHGAPKYEGGAAKTASVATMAALTALANGHPARVHGNEVLVMADQSRWLWHATSTLTSDGILVQSADDVATVTAGRWLRAPGKVNLELPIAYTMADHTALLTLPTGCVFRLEYAHWRITTGFTGGSSSTIAIQSTTLSTAGDVLGGASGEATAVIGTAGVKAGTVGVKLDTDAEIHANLFTAGEVFYYEKITDTYTAGAGFACLEGVLLLNPGA